MKKFTYATIQKRCRPVTATRTVRKIFHSVLKLFLLAVFAVLFTGGFYLWNLAGSIIADAPDITGVATTPAEAATYICNRDGERIQKLTLPESNRDLVLLKNIPEDLQHAVVAIEDERFYEHKGIDPKGILRAFYLGITTGSFSQGASTITQQLLKNTVFPNWTNETTFKERLTRKLQEQYLALKLEKLLTKDQILENYLNMINLGAGSYGVQAASYKYFGKDVIDLTLSECAVIAGITQNPTAYNPITYPEKNAKRRIQVLDAMLRQGYIDQSQYDEALADDVYSRIHDNDTSVDTTSSIYTYYQDALIDQVMQDLQDEKGYTYSQAYQAVYAGGLRIYSAQDEEIQEICDGEFLNLENFPSGTEVGIDYALSVQDADGQITDYGNDDLRAYVRSTSDPSFDLMYDTTGEAEASAKAFKSSVVGTGDTVLGERVTITPQPQASCVIIDQSTGYVLALVGGRGTKDASLTLNRASYTTRQPGSTFKILTAYAPALNEKEMTLATVFTDEAYTYSDGTPVYNADKTYHGEVTMREAIVQSINIPAVQCITAITPKVGYDYAKKFGISTLTDYLETDSGVLTDVNQTLALGGLTKGVTNLELTAAYATIANMGQYIAPKFYTQVFDQYGNLVLDNSSPQSRTIIDSSTATLLTDAMRGVITDPEGTAYDQIDLGQMAVAGKSGTTSDWRDSWFVGYTPYYTCGIWCGYDNNAALPDEDTYHTYCKTLWNAIMNDIHADKHISSFRTSEDVERVSICPATHLAAAAGCPGAYEELFAAGTAPAYYCNVHGDGSLVDPTADTSSDSSSPIVIYSSDSYTIEDTSQASAGADTTGITDDGSTSPITIYSTDQTVINTG